MVSTYSRDTWRHIAQSFQPWVRPIVLGGDLAPTLSEPFRDRAPIAWAPPAPAPPCPGAILIWEYPPAPETIAFYLTSLSLADDGWLLIAYPGAVDDPALRGVLETAGLVPYLARRPREVSRYTLILQHRKCEDPVLGLGLLAVHAGYDPLAHAMALFDTGNADASFEVLDSLPEALLEAPEERLLATTGMQLALMTMCATAPPAERTRLFFIAQQQFYEILNLFPHSPQAFLCQAQCWRLLGNSRMGERVLRSIAYVAPDPAIDAALAKWPRHRGNVPPEEPPPPPWTPSFRPRILVLTHLNLDYGMDTLYDGLCQLLGVENVIEYPWKPLLHGGTLGEGAPYPSQSDYRSAPQSIETLEEELRAGAFDLILFGDVFYLSDQEPMFRLLRAKPEVPVFIVDTWDEGTDYLPRLRAYLDGANIQGYFKHEMVHGIEYGPRTRPLPLCHPDRRFAPAFQTNRGTDLFWAGHRVLGLRRIHLEAVEAHLGRDLDRIYCQEEYARLLDDARIGVSFFGFGYDTYRYWELPAHGCMLLAERTPFRIPLNFVEGESAVFFDDTPELLDKLDFYLAHPNEAEAIARRGYQHAREHHTASARARQMLGHIEALLKTERAPRLAPPDPTPTRPPPTRQ